MLVMRNTITQGCQSGLLTILGGCGGILIHAVLSALGLSLILARSVAVYEIVKLAGSAYLIWLGLLSLCRVFQHHSNQPRHTRSQQPVKEMSPCGSFRDGLLSNILNPKTGLFYLALLPQFVHLSDRTLITSLLLAAVHIAMRFTWLSLITILIQRIRIFIDHPFVQQSLEALTGVILCSLGLRLALARRE